jgi:hypothetical protein
MSFKVKLKGGKLVRWPNKSQRLFKDREAAERFLERIGTKRRGAKIYECGNFSDDVPENFLRRILRTTMFYYDRKELTKNYEMLREKLLITKRLSILERKSSLELLDKEFNKEIKKIEKKKLCDEIDDGKVAESQINKG